MPASCYRQVTKQQKPYLKLFYRHAKKFVLRFATGCDYSTYKASVIFQSLNLPIIQLHFDLIFYCSRKNKMKKALLALAVLGAYASTAHAQVTIGGYLAAQPKSYKVGNENTAARTAGQTMQTEYRVDDDANSRIWFTGKEDLGNGLDAHFYMESRFGGDNGSSSATFGLANGETYVGLGSTSIGSLDFGRLVISAYTQGAAIEADRTSSSGNLGAYNILSDVGAFGISKTRQNNVIRFKTSNLGGFVGTFAISPSVSEEGKVTSATAALNNQYSDGKGVALGGNYTNGPIYLNAYFWKLTTEGRPADLVVAPNTGYTTFTNADQRTLRLTGAYTFPFGLKAGLSIDRSTLLNVAAGSFNGALTTALQGGGTATANGQVTRTAWLIPISYTVGQHAFYGKFGKAGNLSNWTTPGTQSGGTGAKYFEAAYDYALSKRTAVGVSYMRLKNDGNGAYSPFSAGALIGSSLVAGESATSAQINLKHSF
jgi:predicted porin